MIYPGFWRIFEGFLGLPWDKYGLRFRIKLRLMMNLRFRIKLRFMIDDEFKVQDEFGSQTSSSHHVCFGYLGLLRDKYGLRFRITLSFRLNLRFRN